MICVSPKAYNCIESLFYYPYTIGVHLDRAVYDINTIARTMSSLTYALGIHSVTIRNIGTITYTSNGSVVIIQDIHWSPILTRFYYVKSNFITFTSQGNVSSVHPSKYTDRVESHFMCDNGYNVVSRKYRGKEYYNFKDTKGNIICDIDFTQVKPFSKYKNMTARGYTPNRRCFMVFYNGDLEEINEIKINNKINMKRTIRLTESDLRHIISESVRDYLTELDWKTYANAADKASERGQMYYWGDKGEDDLNSYKKAVKNRVRAKRFGDAAKNAFNRDYGYENGHYTDDDYRSVEMKGDFDATEEFGPHIKGYNGNFKNCLGDIRPLSKYSDITPEEYFDGDEEAAQSYRNARSEFDKYRRNDYKYIKGKGWQ